MKFGVAGLSSVPRPDNGINRDAFTEDGVEEVPIRQTVVTARFDGEGLPEAAGEDGVGYQSYRISAPTSQQDSDNASDTSTPSSDAGTIALDRLRNLGLIMLLVGVVMLLLAVWR